MVGNKPKDSLPLGRREFLQMTSTAMLVAAAGQFPAALRNDAGDAAATEPSKWRPGQDVGFLGAAEMADLIRKKRISSVELVRTHLDRVAKYNKALNSIVTLDADGALARARAADEAMTRGENWGPLHGVPVTFKDALETKGMRTTAGFPPLKNYVPTEDAPVVARIKSAGAIVLGKTNMPVLAGGYESSNPIFGTTSNPWNLAYTPGGSTGGGAAAIAAGLSALELGSDIAGSLRWPAHCCGVFSLKPTEWRVPTTGHIPELPGTPRGIRHMLVIGPVSRSIEDLDLALRLIAGPDNQMWEIPPVGLSSSSSASLKGLRVAWTTQFGDAPVTPETREAIHKFVADLETHHCNVKECSLANFNFDDAATTHGALIAAEAPFAFPAAKPVTMGDYIALLTKKDGFTKTMEEFLRTCDVLLTPVACMPAYSQTPLSSTEEVNGQKLPRGVAAGWYCVPFNLTGHPAAVIPLGKSQEGLPIGLQLVTRRWNEVRLLAIAKELAKLTVGFQRPPGY